MIVHTAGDTIVFIPRQGRVALVASKTPCLAMNQKIGAC